MNEEEKADRLLRYVAGAADALLEEDAGLKAEADELRRVWRQLGSIPVAEPSVRLRSQFYLALNAYSKTRGGVGWWRHKLALQCAAGVALFVLGVGVGHLNRPPAAAPEVAELRTQVEGLRRTVALSLMDKQSASARLQGVEWSSQVDQPDQELLTALLSTLNHDQNINVRLASLDALEKFTGDGNVRRALEQSIPTQPSPLLQIALIDALVHIHDSGAAHEFKQLSRDAGMNAAVRKRAQWGLNELNLE